MEIIQNFKERGGAGLLGSPLNPPLQDNFSLFEFIRACSLLFRKSYLQYHESLERTRIFYIIVHSVNIPNAENFKAPFYTNNAKIWRVNTKTPISRPKIVEKSMEKRKTNRKSCLAFLKLQRNFQTTCASWNMSFTENSSLVPPDNTSFNRKAPFH